MKNLILIVYFLIFVQSYTFGEMASRGEVASSSIGGSLRGQETHNGYIYVAQRDSIIILDAKDKNHVQIIGRFSIEDARIDKIVLKWPVIFYSSHNNGSYYSGLGSIDVTNPSAPRKLAPIDVSGSKHFDFKTSGTVLLTRGYGIRAFDISNPLKPTRLAPMDMENEDFESPKKSESKPKPYVKVPPNVLYVGNVRNVVVVGNLAYVMDDDPELKTFDVTDPAKPKYLGLAKDSEKIRVRMEPKKERENDVYSENGMNYQTYKISIVPRDEDEDSTDSEDSYEYNHSMIIQDMAKTNKPKRVTTIKRWMGSGNGADNVNDYWINGHWLFVFGGFRNTGGNDYDLEIYDLKNPMKPESWGSWEGFDHVPEQVYVKDDIKNVAEIYVAEGDDGLTIMSRDKRSKNR